MDHTAVAVPERALVLPPRPAALAVMLSGSGEGQARCATHLRVVRDATADFAQPDTFAEALETAAGWLATHAVGEEATCVPAVH